MVIINKDTTGKIVKMQNRKTGNEYKLKRNGRDIVTINATGTYGDTPAFINALISNCGLDPNAINLDASGKTYYVEGIGGSLKNSSKPVDSNWLATIPSASNFLPVPGTPLFVQKILYYLPPLFKNLINNSNLNPDEFTLEISGGDFDSSSAGVSPIALSSVDLKDKDIEDILTNYIEVDDCKQVVLTGAPGTGKTYSVKKFTEKRVVKKEDIKFVQFHPSYDYTDFVEGLRPVVLDLGGGKKTSFVRMDGTFKEFCRKVVEENLTNFSKPTTFGSYDEFKTIYQEVENEIENLRELASQQATEGEETSPIPVTDLADSNGEGSNETQEQVQQENDQGSTPQEKQEYKRYFFIIDEINRADLSKVFGELMYCLEDGYRGINHIVDTQYKNLKTYYIKSDDGEADVRTFDCFEKGFFIPKNIYIIGTMNDIDRSVEAFDFALRRRFEWIEIKANEVFYKAMVGILTDHNNPFNVNQTDAEILARDLQENVLNMNTIMVKNGEKYLLTDAYHIGHAYFKKYNPHDSTSLEKIYNTNIVSIIKEYTRGRKQNEVEEDLLKPCAQELGVEYRK